MSDSILIQGGRVLDASTRHDAIADLLIENGKITALDKPGQIPASRAKKVIQAKGSWVMPGFIDVHVHLREPGLEYKETIATGTAAAVAGGFTSVACMANTQPVNDNPFITAFIREQARKTGLCRVFPIGAVSKGLQGKELAEIGGMVSEGARAISDDGMPVMNALLMRRAMEYALAFGVPVISHAEDANLSNQGVMNEGHTSCCLGLRGNPSASEEIMVAREIALSRLTGCPLHIAHVSSKLSLEHIRRAKEDGLHVTAEVSPHHLSLTEESLRAYETRFKVAPPLRMMEDVEALKIALKDGLIDMIATDHAPHGLIDKEVELDTAAFGMIGLQTAVAVTLELVHEGRLPLMRWLDSLTVKPAKLLGVPHGSLAIGRDADITVFDAEARIQFSEDRILSRSKNSPFLGRDLRGVVKATLVGGHLAYETH